MKLPVLPGQEVVRLLSKLLSIIKQAGMTRDGFLELCEKK